MTNKILFLFCFLGIYVAVSAQSVISGTVYDENNEPLIGANILLQKKHRIVATTDDFGKYKLTLPDDETTIIVSYVGYIPQTFALKKQGEITKDFYLKEVKQELNEIVVTGTRTPKSLKDVPIVTRVITADEIKKVDATHIGEILASELPGVEFTYAMNQQLTLNFQGFGGNSMLFLVDGERIAGETLNNIDYSRLSLDNVERIEIVKGAASSLYGSNAVGGVVNIISRASTKLWSLSLNSRFGAYNSQRYGAVASFNAGKFNNSFTLQHNNTNTINLKKAGDFTRILGEKTWNFKDRLIFKPTKKMKLTGRVGYFFRESDNVGVKKARYRGFNGGLKGNYDFNKSNNLEVAYSFDQYDKSTFNSLNKYDIRGYSNVQNSVNSYFNHTFDGQHILTVGADYMRDYLMSYQFKNGGNHSQYTADVFAQFDWRVNKNFSIISGLRYDYYSNAKKQNLSPKVGMMYKMNRFSFRGSYAGGFRAPTLKEMYMHFNMANIFMIYGNPNLNPEYSHNFSLSTEYTKGHFNITVIGTHNFVNNRITTAWDEARKGMLYMNMEDLQITGLETNASVKYPNGFSARVSYAYIYEHIKKGTRLFTQTRPHTATTQINYDKKWKKYALSLSLQGRFLSGITLDEYSSATNGVNQNTYPGYMMWRLNVSQRFFEGANVNVAVDNLLNYVPDYYYNNSPSTPGTTFSVGLLIDVDKFLK